MIRLPNGSVASPTSNGLSATRTHLKCTEPRAHLNGHGLSRLVCCNAWPQRRVHNLDLTTRYGKLSISCSATSDLLAMRHVLNSHRALAILKLLVELYPLCVCGHLRINAEMAECFVQLPHGVTRHPTFSRFASHVWMKESP